MSASEISRRYAKALFSELKQNGKHANGLEELRQIQKILEADPQTISFLKNSRITGLQKSHVVKEAFSNRGLSPSALQFLLILSERGRMHLISEIVSAYESQLDAEMGVTRGVVRAAKPLQPEYQKELESKMNEVLKKRIVLTYKEDPSLLAGVIAEVGGWTFDDSIQSHLTHMSEILITK